MEIKVVGPGCKNCKNLLQATETAVKELGAAAQIIYVTDMVEIAATGVMRTPGLVIDGKIKVSGRVPAVQEIKQLIQSEM
jgi:small redox-active disulfide protein 2